MSLFTHEARQFKFDVLREVAHRSFSGNIGDSLEDELARLLIPTNDASFRCCVYKEREIIRQRTRMALGKSPVFRKEENKKQIVQVLEAACDGCTIHKICVTDNCRKCMAKSCLASCKFDAMKMGLNSAYIDYDKCKECGACVNACPFNAIVETMRPCRKSCPVDAITMDECNIAKINEEKCINCGACQSACPFGAIEDVSQMVEVVEVLNSKQAVTAIIAPAIQGQMDNATLPQIKEAIRLLGFDDVLEAALGADAVAWYEKNELLKHKAENVKLTTSCCPAFVNMARLHFPTIYENNVSNMVSPMEAVARYLKANKETKVVFIGPCVAKKQEAMQDFSVVDYVLTFEELAALLVAKHINVEGVEARAEDVASGHGRGFAIGGGVSKAVLQAAKECNDPEGITSIYADGAFECKKNLLMMKVGRFSADILEGMCCPGGCICGPAAIETPNKVKQRMNKENMSIKEKSIQSTLDTMDFSNINLHK